jgi:acetyltransferase-like isoleucine patch superfamily enzyme
MQGAHWVFFAYFGGKKPSAEGKWACWFANLFLGYELSIVVILISVKNSVGTLANVISYNGQIIDNVISII